MIPSGEKKGEVKKGGISGTIREKKGVVRYFGGHAC